MLVEMVEGLETKLEMVENLGRGGLEMVETVGRVESGSTSTWNIRQNHQVCNLCSSLASVGNSPFVTLVYCRRDVIAFEEDSASASTTPASNY